MGVSTQRAGSQVEATRRTLGVGARLAVHPHLVHGHAAHGAPRAVGAEPFGGAERLVLPNQAATVTATHHIAGAVLPLGAGTCREARREVRSENKGRAAAAQTQRRTGSGAATRASFFSHLEHTIPNRLSGAQHRGGEGEHTATVDGLASADASQKRMVGVAVAPQCRTSGLGT